MNVALRLGAMKPKEAHKRLDQAENETHRIIERIKKRSGDPDLIQTYEDHLRRLNTLRKSIGGKDA